MKVFASPRVPNSPETPKSQSLTAPDRVRRMLEGLMSGGGSEFRGNGEWGEVGRGGRGEKVEDGKK